MSKVWNFFTLEGIKAKCKNCTHQNDFSNNKSTSGLINHLKRVHPDLHIEYLRLTELKKNDKPVNQRTISSMISPDSCEITPLMLDISQLIAKDGFSFNQ